MVVKTFKANVDHCNFLICFDFTENNHHLKLILPTIHKVIKFSPLISTHFLII